MALTDERARLIALAERCEAASEGSRELDAIIHNAIGRPLPDQFCGVPVVLDYDELECTFTMPVGSGEHAMRVRYECPAYTASIDAAVSLVPEGDWALSVTATECLATIPAGASLGDAVHGYAATPALALTAASLRARATENHHD